MPTFKEKLERAKQDGELRISANTPVISELELVEEPIEVIVEKPKKKPAAKKPAVKKESKTTTKKPKKNGKNG